MATKQETWTPYGECPNYTHANISLPEGFTAAETVRWLIQGEIIADQVVYASDEDGIETWDVQASGLKRRLISSRSRPDNITIWSSRGDRLGPRDLAFEYLVRGIREEIKGAIIKICT